MVSEPEVGTGQNPKETEIGEPLSANIEIEPFSYGGYWPDGSWTPFTIYVGNTGMGVVPTVYESYNSIDLRNRIKEGEVYWEYHFTPESAEEPVGGYGRKYALVYNYALGHFLKWWEDPQVFQDMNWNAARIGDKFRRPGFLIGKARNQTMRDFQLRLLGGEIFEARGLQYPKEGIGNSRIDLNKLAGNRAVRARIEKFSKECETAHFKMIPDLHKNIKTTKEQ